MTIVCATHFSNSSIAAVKAASVLAAVHHEHLCLISVVPPRNFIDPPGELRLSEALQLQVTALTDDGIETEMAVLHGPLERAVRQYCEQRAATLLVVGDGGDTSASTLASTPLHLFKDGVDVPLLVVRDERPFEAWVLGRRPMKVMLALDHTWSSAAACDWMSQLAKYGPIDLLVAFVWWPEHEAARQGLKANKEDGYASTTSIILKELEAALQALPATVHHRVQLELGADHIADKLVAMAALDQVDLFVLGSHPVHGPIARMRRFSSVSSGVLAEAPMSVALIPSRVAPQVAPVIATSPLKGLR